MILVIGLGNPGKKYEKNRHNSGFIAIEELRKSWNLPDFKLEKKFNAEISEGIVSVISSKVDGSNSEKNKIILAKSQTFMNNSGETARKILDFYKLTPADLIVIHDDLDIELGKYKISEDSSAAGHNGVQSIIDYTGTRNFKRIRIGIEGEELRKSRNMSGEEFVLQNFSEEEMETIKKLAKDITL